MTETDLKGVEFDPGFGPYVLAFRGSMEYIYLDINKFKNLSQRKLKFKMYYKKILDLFYNNLGFYVGCLMWAMYIKSLPEQKLLSNTCYGGVYNHEENVSETQYMSKFVELFPKDMKYYLGQNFCFEENVARLINVYEKFLELNKGFVATKTNISINLPKSLKSADVELLKKYVDEVTNSGNLHELVPHISEII